MKDKIYNCRVCGFYMKDPPWGEDGKTPTYEICPCCGVEFGNEDYTFESTLAYRAKWLYEKITFYEAEFKPKNWDFEEQIKCIPEEFKK